MTPKKKCTVNNFHLQFQDEPENFIGICHFGIKAVGIQTALTLGLLTKIIINPNCCKGKHPCINVVDKSVNTLLKECTDENNDKIIENYSRLYVCAYTQFSRESLKCVSCGQEICRSCHHLSFVLGEIIHKPISTCIHRGEKKYVSRWCWHNT